MASLRESSGDILVPLPAGDVVTLSHSVDGEPEGELG